MSHRHDNCTRPSGGAVCTEGHLTDYCNDVGDDYECNNEYCAFVGHCRCRCHDGKTCACGYVWPRQERQTAPPGPPVDLPFINRNTHE